MKAGCIRFKTLLLAGFTVLVSSCAPVNRLTLEIMRPASFTVDPSILSIVVADHAYPHRSDSIHLIVLPHDTVLVDTILVDDFGFLAARALSEELQNRQFFDTVHFHQVSLNKPPDGANMKIMPVNTVYSLASEYNVQAVVALEKAEYTSRINISYLGGYYHVALDANGELFWKLYDPRGFVLDVYMQRDSIYWDNVVAVHENQQHQLPAIRDAIEILANFMGQTYSNRLAPRWETVRRFHLPGGHYLFDRANELRNAHNWEEAAKIWYHLYSTGNNLQKARAAHNLALSFEVRGNIREAYAWSDVSLNYFTQLNAPRVPASVKSISREYNTELRNRMIEVTRLQQQLGSVF